MGRVHVLLATVLGLQTLCQANDGFYQGSGTTLVPVENTHMQVLREDLDIKPIKSACYDVVFPPGAYDAKHEPVDGTQLSLTSAVPCPANLSFNKQLITKFHAKAVYKIKSLTDQAGVQMGFPVPQWTYDMEGKDGLVEMVVPAVVGFKTSIDGRPIKDVRLGKVPIGAGSDPTTAFIWTLDFKKDQAYELVSEYDFGVDYSGGMYDGTGHEFRFDRQHILWFDKRSVAETEFSIGQPFQSEGIIYYLKPLKLWTGGVPEEVRVRIEAPAKIPIYYMTPLTRGLDCVDRHALYYRWRHAYPDEDLHILYPVDKGRGFKYRGIQTQYEYDAWESLLANLSNVTQTAGRTPRMTKTCDLVQDLLKVLPKDAFLRSWVKSGVETCVASCD